MMWTDDPVRDWDRYCDEQERELERYPKCERCEAPLYEHMYNIDGKVLCEDCETELYADMADDYDTLLYCEKCGKPLTGFVHIIDDEILCDKCVYKLYGERVKVEY